MKIDLDVLLTNKLEKIGKDYWIADVNFSLSEPRVLKPTLARLFDSVDTRKNKHYSHPFFVPYCDSSSGGKLLDCEIGICDNILYRSKNKNPIAIFYEKNSAVSWFNDMIKKEILRINNSGGCSEKYRKMIISD